MDRIIEIKLRDEIAYVFGTIQLCPGQWRVSKIVSAARCHVEEYGYR